jgi:hypothetical protein
LSIDKIFVSSPIVIEPFLPVHNVVGNEKLWQTKLRKIPMITKNEEKYIFYAELKRVDIRTQPL